MGHRGDREEGAALCKIGAYYSRIMHGLIGLLARKRLTMPKGTPYFRSGDLLRLISVQTRL